MSICCYLFWYDRLFMHRIVLESLPINPQMFLNLTSRFLYEPWLRHGRGAVNIYAQYKTLGSMFTIQGIDCYGRVLILRTLEQD